MRELIATAVTTLADFGKLYKTPRIIGIARALAVALKNDHVGTAEVLARSDNETYFANALASPAHLSPLILAARAGSAAAITMLLQCKAYVGWSDLGTGRSALHFAAREGHVSAVRALVLANAKVNCHDRCSESPWDLAARCKRASSAADVIRVLVQSKADADRSLGVLDNCRTRAAVKAVLAAKVCVDGRDRRNGSTPLMFAVKNARVNVVSALLEARAAVDEVVEYDGNGVLHWAAYGLECSSKYSATEYFLRCKMVPTVKLLLAAKASTNATNNAGHTALHVANDVIEEWYRYRYPESSDYRTICASFMELLRGDAGCDV